MSSRAHAERLAHALTSTGLCEAVKHDYSGDQISVLLRVNKDQEPAWIDLVFKMRKTEKILKGAAHTFQAHICKHYFLKEPEEKLVFGWNINIQSQFMTESLGDLITVVKGGSIIPPAGAIGDHDIMEMPLTGMEGVQDRNKPKPGSKKGAYVGVTVPIDRR